MSGDAAEQQQLIDSFADLGGERDGREDAYAARPRRRRPDGWTTRRTADVHELAVAYRERFGFPLIVCARDVGDRYERGADHRLARMANAPAVERAAALMEVAKIANYRFDDLVADANPIASARVARYEEANR